MSRSERPKMDRLLSKLRRSMAELSLQGDDFARQMWQMYAIFEEVVGNHAGYMMPALEDHKEPLMTGSCPSLDKALPVTNVGTGTSNVEGEEGGDAGIHERIPTSTTPQAKEDVHPASSRLSTVYGSPGVRRKRLSVGSVGASPMAHDRHYSQTLQRGGNPQHHRSRSEPSSNPLLDTINVLTYDPCDSDDYYDLRGVYQQRKILVRTEADKTRASPSSHQHSDGDRDSIGYAGSNSIDSGYKSLCPTPEIPEMSTYHVEPGTKGGSSSGGGTDSSSTSSPTRGRDATKPNIMMGTRVMERQGFKPQRSGAFGMKRHDSGGYYDVNLDHLMYLRQSLLSAIQQCESSSSSPSRDGSPVIFSRSDSPSLQRLSSSASPKRTRSPQTEKKRPTSQTIFLVPEPSRTGQDTAYPSGSPPSYQKTVRFESDVAKLSSPAKSTGQAGSPGGPAKTKQSKSILKDPLCASLRSQLESGATDCTLEEEIDSLLYGKAEYYDLESVEDFPCSYVTMIEEKYRCGKSSVAKVKRLKEKLPDGSVPGRDSPQSSHPGPRHPSPAPQSSEPPAVPPASTRPKPQDGQHPTKAPKSRFTEVARCMLDILEDLHKKQSEHKQTKLNTAAAHDRSGSSSGNKSENEPQGGDVSGLLREGDQESCTMEGAEVQGATGIRPPFYPRNANTTNSWDTASVSGVSSASYNTVPEYHVYEEIIYDCLGNAGHTNTNAPAESTRPPPLPTRPNPNVPSARTESDHMRAAGHQGGPLPPGLAPTGDGGLVFQGNRPKQRSNLYSLFTDQVERRNLSRSLEQEWRVNHSGSVGADDDYGFKKPAA